MDKTVLIDWFPESVKRYVGGYAVGVVDVIRATTTAITAVAGGRRCFTVPSVEAAWELAAQLKNPLLVGEVGGTMPVGFDMNNSPSLLARRTDVNRPVILLSSSGSVLIHNARECRTAYVASFRNYSFFASYLAKRHERIAIVGAGSRGEFREEDQMCCAWIAAILARSGFRPENQNTSDLIQRWKDAPLEAFLTSESVDYLKRTGQEHDLEFILTHINDVPEAYAIREDEIVSVRCRPTIAAEEPGTDGIDVHTQ